MKVRTRLQVKKVFKIGCFSALGIFVLFIVLAILLLEFPETEYESTTPAKSAFEKLCEMAAHRVHVTQLVKDYKANEFAADEKYKKQIILVQGNITHFDDTYGMFLNMKDCLVRHSFYPIGYH